MLCGCYPKLHAAQRHVDTEQELSGHSTVSPFQAERIREAVRRERQRVQPREVDEPKTALGRELKKVTGAPTALIDDFIEEEATEILEMLERPPKSH